MSSVAEEMPSPLIFSEAAAAKVKELIEDEGNDALKLRVFISGGGCSGFQYGFTFDEEIGEGDTVIENDGVKLLVDPMSFQYLTGARLITQRVWKVLNSLSVIRTRKLPAVVAHPFLSSF